MLTCQETSKWLISWHFMMPLDISGHFRTRHAAILVPAYLRSLSLTPSFSRNEPFPLFRYQKEQTLHTWGVYTNAPALHDRAWHGIYYLTLFLYSRLTVPRYYCTTRLSLASTPVYSRDRTTVNHRVGLSDTIADLSLWSDQCPGSARERNRVSRPIEGVS